MRITTYLLLTVLSAACTPNQQASQTEPQTQDQPPVAPSSETITQVSTKQAAVDAIVTNARRVPNSTGWFEVLHLPNQVYAFWEPGHVEKVNSFLIIGRDKDLLYDTGMGIANIERAIRDVRASEGLPQHDVMVVNSHNHLDHNGGNQEFEEIWTLNHPWAIRRLTTGVPAGEEGGFLTYWGQLTPHQGVQPPPDFSPASHAIPPFPNAGIRFLKPDQTIDLGDRRLQVKHTTSHSPDGIALYSPDEKLFFGGDTFYGADYLVTDVALLAQDLANIENLDIAYHYASHGAQLIVAMEQGQHLAVVRRIAAGEGKSSMTNFAGFALPMESLDGVSVIVAKELLLY